MASTARNPTTDHSVHKIDHIKKLPEADKALKMLEEIKRHADPLLQARGWRVLKLYEICCCSAGGKNTRIGGFCCPAGDGKTSLRIALRLRQPKSHELHSFDHCMRVMIHEMSHIMHGNHSAQFYQLMEVRVRSPASRFLPKTIRAALTSVSPERCDRRSWRSNTRRSSPRGRSSTRRACRW